MRGKITTNTTLLRLGIGAVLTFSGIIAGLQAAEFDSKFNRKAAEKVWAMNLPEFNAGADLTDSIYQNVSGVNIADYLSVRADLNTFGSDYAKYRNTGREATNRIESQVTHRRMVKLNDAQAVEKYSTFDIELTDDVTFNSYTVSSSRTAFGVRVYKPDGTMGEVDCSNAYAVKEGKKDEVNTYRVAVEGLEPGDVIDYFYYTESELDEYSLPTRNISILRDYPTLNLIVDYQVHPELTVEYKDYNGAPPFKILPKTGNFNHFGFHLQNIPGLESTPILFSERRQLPFVAVAVLNNYKSIFEYHPGSARIGGVNRQTVVQLTTDAGHAINDTRIDEGVKVEAKSIFKKWLKNHPEATLEEKADAAWLTTIYTMITKKNSLGGRSSAMMFTTLLKECGIKENLTIGFATNYYDVPASESLRFNDPDYYAHVGDRYYFAKLQPALTPAESVAPYSNCEAIEFPAPEKGKSVVSSSVFTTMPIRRPKDNSLTVTTRVVSSATNDSAFASSKITAIGLGKLHYDDLVTSIDYLANIEKYLGIKSTSEDKLIRDKEKYREVMQERAVTIAQDLYDRPLDDRSVEYTIVNSGAMPDNPIMEIDISAKVADVVTEAGNRLMVNIGHFISEHTKITGKWRQRDIDVVLPMAGSDRFNIELIVPEGYMITEEAAKSLNRSVTNRVGVFMSETSLTPEGNLLLKVITRFNHQIYPTEMWPEVLEILDAANDFTTAIVPMIVAQ